MGGLWVIAVLALLGACGRFGFEPEDRPIGSDAPGLDALPPEGADAMADWDALVPTFFDAAGQGDADPAGADAGPAGADADPTGADADPTGADADPTGADADPFAPDADPAAIDAAQDAMCPMAAPGSMRFLPPPVCPSG